MAWRARAGKRRHGKPQLRIDEARKWMATATELAAAGEAGAVAAMLALLLGMRASEIVSRVMRDLDDDGRLLWLPDSKTEAGKRTLRVPEVLRESLQGLVADRKSDALLFGVHWRDWPREWVQRICAHAGVPNCDGTRDAGAAFDAGDGGGGDRRRSGGVPRPRVGPTTTRSYAKPEAVAAARQDRALTVLTGGKTAAAS